MKSLQTPHKKNMYTSTNKEKLFDLIINNNNNNNCDEFIVISGYLGLEPIIEFSKKGIDTKIFYGMANEALHSKLHKKLMELDSQYYNLEISYPKITCHAKIYIWKKNNKIINALSGSANFSSNSLLKINREVLTDVFENDYEELNEYIALIQSSSTRCIDHSINDEVIKKDVNLDPNIFISSSLFQKGSKINWGHSNAHVNKRDAYIGIRRIDIRNYPHFFPPKQSNRGLGYADNEPIDVLWDDGKTMLCLLEGNNKLTDHTNIRYPNKISSFKSKRIMGDYLRKRMGLDPGVFVTKTNFDNYGRDNIEISIISAGVYHFNFGIK